MIQALNVLGSTGSVGQATLDVAAANPEVFSVQVLSAQTNVQKLAEQARAHKAKRAVIGDEALYAELKEALSGSGVEVSAGRAALLDAAAIPADCTMAAIVGMAGLEPLLSALPHSKKVAIANKEPLVSAGKLVLDLAERHGTKILPVDSEHNAIFQVFENANRAFVRRIILTASGGPFREWTSAQMTSATPAQAVAHPNWSMGAKISVDSATLMNKALEVIEAHHLFGMHTHAIDVVLHPQSIIHSMVEYEDGSVLAQMGAPDMRVPITHALGWPGRMKGPAQHLDFTQIPNLTFGEVDHGRFPAINLAYHCLREGEHACIAFNAANEVAVESFLAGRIGFMDILDVIKTMLSKTHPRKTDGLESILALDAEIRHATHALINNTASNRKVS
jgi:1-deoxy-D-xylulose-5-phosphate reductoisomerase